MRYKYEYLSGQFSLGNLEETSARTEIDKVYIKKRFSMKIIGKQVGNKSSGQRGSTSSQDRDLRSPEDVFQKLST